MVFKFDYQAADHIDAVPQWVVQSWVDAVWSSSLWSGLTLWGPMLQ